MDVVRVFISYAWEDDAYRAWVRRLARTLRDHGIEARLDAWHQEPGQDFPSFMNAETRLADRILVLGSPQYRDKVHAFEENRGTAGVGWEAMLLTARIFEGERRKLAVAVARGERVSALPDFLLTQAAHDLRAPDDPRGVQALVEDLLGRRPVAPPLGRPPRAEPQDDTPLFENPPELRLALELRAWVDARWPEGRADAIYPPWSELEAGKVTFPEGVIAAVRAALARSPRALVVGTSASGKSVLGASVAYDWSRRTGRRAFWLDLGDHAGVSPDAIHRDVEAFLALSGANLLVLDNAQVAPSLADWAVSQVEVAERADPGQHRLLVLTRPLQQRVQHQAGLQDRLVGECTALVPDAALFEAVAVRLLGRRGPGPAWHASDYAAWVGEFGGDLICFGQAVLGAGASGRPTRSLAAARVRHHYIDPAAEREGGISVLDRLCAAAILDLSPDDASLDGKVQRAVPHLIEGGQLQAFERGQFRQWKLVHPGMGSLILETRARDTGRQEIDLMRSALLDLARSNPFQLGSVVLRLVNPSYTHYMDVVDWSRALHTERDLLESFLCTAPTYVAKVDRRLPRLLPWDMLRDGTKRQRLLATWRRFSPDEIVMFMRQAERHEPAASLTLLSELLEDKEFQALLTRKPPHFVAAFMRYAEQHERDATLRLLRALLADSAFGALLARTPPDLVAAFLRYAQQHEHAVTLVLLRELLANPALGEQLAHAPLGDVVTFLRYAEKHERKAVLKLLGTLLHDVELRASLTRAPPNDLVLFLGYAEQHEREVALALLHDVLRDAGLRAVLLRTQPHFVMTFLRYAEQHERDAVLKLLDTLLRDDGFRASLARTPLGDFVAFVRYAEQHEREIAVALLRDILRDADFRAVLTRTSPHLLASGLRYVAEHDRALAADCLAQWWPVFRASAQLASRDQPLVCDGYQLVHLAPVLRLAHELAPAIADDLVEWLNTLGQQLVDALRPVSAVQRFGLGTALRDTERQLEPQLWEAVARPD